MGAGGAQNIEVKGGGRKKREYFLGTTGCGAQGKDGKGGEEDLEQKPPTRKGKEKNEG